MSLTRSWEQLEGESDAEWAAFGEYRDLGPGRDLKTVCSKVGRSLATIKRYSSRHRWTERAAAWDAELTRRGDDAALDEAEQIKRDHLRVLKKARRVAEKKIDALLEHPEQLTTFGAARLLFAAVTAERLAIGEATERVDGTGAWDLSKLSPEELEALEELRSKAQGEGGGDEG